MRARTIPPGANEERIHQCLHELHLSSFHVASGEVK